MSLIINSRYNYSKPNILCNIDNNTTITGCNKCPQEIQCCIKADLFVEKTLLSVYKVKRITNDGYDKIVLSYDITLINESCYEITNVGIQDTLFNLMGSIQALIGLRIISCCDSLVVRSVDDIYEEDCPQLLKSSISYIPPCSACRIIVTVIVVGYPETTVEIRQLMNTITVTGRLKSEGPCGTCKQTINIEPIVKKSILWTEENGLKLIG